ncbi:MAG: hypothetical protein BSOLF_1684 [Candidatus Carbobacillus altaicus]|uniref:Uncharacterized protein n=1 Tax=Candidatus Carbonibacillus altaicus TaxID=2163959 RepID=A0A2R6Y3Y7_9BACL|nr:MAG: hypothetical protein BSOLF_1684 [Candidatus Carbobacillus altaicus]
MRRRRVPFQVLEVSFSLAEHVDVTFYYISRRESRMIVFSKAYTIQFGEYVWGF